MGMFDTLVEGSDARQVKCFDRQLNTYKVGDRVPLPHGVSEHESEFSILLDEWGNGEEYPFAIFRRGVFVGFSKAALVPCIDKWGDWVSVGDDIHPAMDRAGNTDRVWADHLRESF